MEPTDPSSAPSLPDHTVLNGRVEFLAAARRLVLDARYSLSLMSDELDVQVFGDESFTDAVRHFALLHRHARLRVLVARPQKASRESHSLVNLGRQLTSHIEFREYVPDRPVPRGELLLADGRLLLERNTPDALESRLSLGDALLARERQKRFDELWDHAVPCHELRRLRI